MRSRKCKSIWIDKKAYFYLRSKEDKQRGCPPMSKDTEARIWKRLIFSGRVKNGLYQVYDNSFGGRTYNGRWWSWSVDDLIEMLDRAGFKYRKGKDIEVI